MSSIDRNLLAQEFTGARSSPIRRAPVFASNVVATSQPLASEAGLQALRSGGNAVDAALAAAITLAVVEPCSNGLGSDALALVWSGTELVGINGSGRSPEAWSLDRFAGRKAMPTSGWDSVTVPGAVSVWSALSSRFGRLPFPALFDSAISYAERGFPVGPHTAMAWKVSARRFSASKSFMRHFLPDGEFPRAGDMFRSADLARTLRLIAESRGAEFYRGSLARQMARQAANEGGLLSEADLSRHAPEWVQPLAQEYGTVKVHELPPNAQGLAAQIALAILDHLNTASMEPEGADWVHFQAEAMKIAIRAAFEHFADTDSMRLPPEALLEPESIRRAAQKIKRHAAAPIPIALPAGSDTVCLATGDENGMMASFIQSNYMGFGSGVVVDGTGIALQNRGAGFVLTPGHPNQAAGSKRPFHTIIPGFVTRGDQPSLAFGLMGGHMQHQGHVQMVTRIYDHGQDPQSASDAPRWHVLPNMNVVLENGYDTPVRTELLRRGHTVRIGSEPSLFGGAQLVYRTTFGYCAGSDHRKEGCAAGF